jgi:hypothetical protein
MLQVRKILSKLVHVPKPVLGRWGTECDSKQMNTRIDLANEDHCGPCGTYVLNKHDENSLKKNTNKTRLSHEEFMKWTTLRRRQ